MAHSQALFVVFDGPPGHVSGRFVDVEDHDGRNPEGGSGAEWSQRDGLWLLGPFAPRIVELKAREPDPPEHGRIVDWSPRVRPARVVIYVGEPKPLVELPFRLVADADYVLSIGGVLKDLDGRFQGRNPSGDLALNELALEGPVEYVRWPA